MICTDTMSNEILDCAGCKFINKSVNIYLRMYFIDSGAAELVMEEILRMRASVFLTCMIKATSAERI